LKNWSVAKSNRLGHPVRSFFARYASLLLILLASALMITSRIDRHALEGMRMFVVDMTAPVVEVVSRPVNKVISSFQSATDLTTLRSDNMRLEAENMRLRQWYETALRLEAENISLRSLLNAVPDPQMKFITARIVSDAGGAFVRSFLVGAGSEDGVDYGFKRPRAGFN